jgi:hypothetical protein
MQTLRKFAQYGGAALIAYWGGRKILVSLGVITDPAEAAATATVNANFSNDIAWSATAFDALNRIPNQTMPPYTTDYLTKYIILQTASQLHPRQNIYNTIENFFVNVLPYNPNSADIQTICDYINQYIYCQMEISFTIRDTKNGYPDWDIKYFVNQTWWTKWLDPANTVLLPLFNTIHNLPNLINFNGDLSDKANVLQQVIDILSVRGKIPGH